MPPVYTVFYSMSKELVAGFVSYYHPIVEVIVHKLQGRAWGGKLDQSSLVYQSFFGTVMSPGGAGEMAYLLS